MKCQAITAQIDHYTYYIVLNSMVSNRLASFEKYKIKNIHNSKHYGGENQFS